MTRFFDLFKRLIFTRELVKKEKPDVIIAFLSHIFFEIKLATLGLDVPIIASDQ